MRVHSVMLGCLGSSQANQRTASNPVKMKKMTNDDDDVLEVYMYHTYVHPAYNLVWQNSIVVILYFNLSLIF